MPSGVSNIPGAQCCAIVSGEFSMKQESQLAVVPKRENFSLSPAEDSREAPLLPSLAEVGVDTEYTGVVRVGGKGGAF
jgi:hypothetical protein